MVWMLQPQIMPPCCIGMTGADQDVLPSWLDQLLIDAEDDQLEPLDTWLSPVKEIAEPLAAAS
jgi:hypothetical protein